MQDINFCKLALIFEVSGRFSLQLDIHIYILGALEKKYGAGAGYLQLEQQQFRMSVSFSVAF